MFVIFLIYGSNITHSVNVVAKFGSLLQSWPCGLHFDSVTSVKILPK